MSTVFASSDVFRTLSDVLIYKHRIKYLTSLHDKFKDKRFNDTLLDEAHAVFNTQMSHITACGSFLNFRVLEGDHTVGKLANGSFCRQRICPLCQRRKSLKLYTNILQMLEPIKNKYAFLHLTLTVPNCHLWEARSKITELFNASKALFNTARVKQCFKGVIRSLEVTQNKGTLEMHPHLHCLVVVNKSYFKSRYYIPFDELREIWGGILGIKNPQLSIRRCTTLEDCVRECVKYASKPIDLESKNPGALTDIQAIHYYISVAYALRSRRLIQCFGICAELSKAFHIELNDDEEVDEDFPEYTQSLYFTFNHFSQEFDADPYRYGDERKEHDFTNKEHFENLQQKKKEYVNELIRHRADWVLKHMTKK